MERAFNDDRRPKLIASLHEPIHRQTSVNSNQSLACAFRLTLSFSFFLSLSLSLSIGLIAHGITTPIDVVKTRMQTEPKKYNKGMKSATLQLVKEEGPMYLLTGLAPTVVGYGLEGAMKFGVYEAFKPICSMFIKNMAASFLIASIFAGAIASVMLCPMESTRIRLVTEPKFANGLLSGLSRLIQEEGLAAQFSGVYAMLAKQIPYTMMKQVTFDIFATLLYSLAAKFDLSDMDGLKILISFAAAFCASVLACIGSQPGDMLLTQTYRGSSNRGVRRIAADIYKADGIGGFFTGTGARLVHVVSIITTQLMIYDFVKQGLGLPASGSH
jgi:solute carrier family 25 phosphate transporter 3